MPEIHWILLWKNTMCSCNILAAVCASPPRWRVLWLASLRALACWQKTYQLWLMHAFVLPTHLPFVGNWKDTLCRYSEHTSLLLTLKSEHSFILERLGNRLSGYYRPWIPLYCIWWLQHQKVRRFWLVSKLAVYPPSPLKRDSFLETDFL